MHHLGAKIDKSWITKERIKELLRDSGKQQQELADDLGYSVPYFSAILNGRRPFPVAAAKRISEVFPDVRWQWVLGLDNFKTNHAVIKAQIAGGDFAYSAIEDLVESFGFSLAVSDEDYEKGEETAYNEMRELNISCYPPESTVSVCHEVDGILGSYPAHEIRRLFDEIIEFARFKLDRIIERAGENV